MGVYYSITIPPAIADHKIQFPLHDLCCRLCKPVFDDAPKTTTNMHIRECSEGWELLLLNPSKGS